MNVLASYGVRIEPMRRLGAGRGDSILHTLKHFLCRQEYWGALEPREALMPDNAMEKLRPLGKVTTCSQVVSSRYLEPPWLKEIEPIHEQGYYPRYALLAQGGGPWDQPGSLWQRGQGVKRWVAELRGYR